MDDGRLVKVNIILIITITVTLKEITVLIKTIIISILKTHESPPPFSPVVSSLLLLSYCPRVTQRLLLRLYDVISVNRASSSSSFRSNPRRRSSWGRCFCSAIHCEQVLCHHHQSKETPLNELQRHIPANSVPLSPVSLSSGSSRSERNTRSQTATGDSTWEREAQSGWRGNKRTSSYDNFHAIEPVNVSGGARTISGSLPLSPSLLRESHGPLVLASF